MVLADALCAMNVAASAIINGVCCCYQMNHEANRQKDHEKAIRYVYRDNNNKNNNNNNNNNKECEMMTRKRDDLIKAYNDYEHRHRRRGQPFANGYDSRNCGRRVPATEDTGRRTETLSSLSFSRMATPKSRNRFRRPEQFPELFSAPSLIDNCSGQKAIRNSSLGDPIHPRLSLLDDDDDDDDDEDDDDDDDGYSFNENDSLSDNDNDTEFEEICLE